MNWVRLNIAGINSISVEITTLILAKDEQCLMASEGVRRPRQNKGAFWPRIGFVHTLSEGRDPAVPRPIDPSVFWAGTLH